MPEGYSISLLSRFRYSYEHVGSLLNIFSQLTTCKVMFLLDEKRELEVREIRRNLKGVQSFVISKSLTSLRNHNIIDKVERTYILKNDIFFRRLSDAAVKVLGVIGKKPAKEKVNEFELKNTAELFSQMFFDDVSNILMHILLIKARKFNEISEIYRHAHGYVPTSTLRYHLSTRRVDVGGRKIKIFDTRNRNYMLSAEGRKIHDIFDNFIIDYENSIEKWINDMWGLPLKELTKESIPIVDLRDSIHKLLRLLYNSAFIIAFSNKPEGIITTKNVMNKIGSNLGNVGFLSDTTVKDIMTPISPDQVISGKSTLLELFKREKGFEHNHYIVDLGGGMYSVLSIYDVLKMFSVA